MMKNTDSDFNPTMNACIAFENVLNCVKTSKLNCSSSLPNLPSLSWVTNEEVMMDEAEQALNDQYDREVSSFYTDAKLKAAAIRSLYEENAIADLFKEDEKL